MAQFALYRNKDPRTRAAIPLLVDIQNDLLESLGTRVVIPLSKAGNLKRNPSKPSRRCCRSRVRSTCC
jgi:toxin CcdB